VAVALGLVAVLAYGGARWYDAHQQELAYAQWEARSTAYAVPVPSLDPSTDAFGEDPTSASTPDDDAGAAFIRGYYADIAAHRLRAAYAASKQSVPYATFAAWYKDVRSMVVERIAPLGAAGEGKYTVTVTVRESVSTSRYAVLMDVGQDMGGWHVYGSTVRLLPSSVGTVDASTLPEAPLPVPAPLPNDLPLLVTNAEFSAALGSKHPPFVLDAREDEEYVYGNLPGAQHHIRMADVIAGRWAELPVDQPVYVLCWSGIRGKEVAEFLRGKGVPARYVEKGASGWVAWGGDWEGDITFTAVHPESRYSLVFTTADARRLADQGVVLVDARPVAKYEAWHIPGSVNVPIMSTPTASLPEVLGRVPPGSNVITVCDDYVNCFDARISGLKLEVTGSTFLGRYASPWEWR
jgi:rhodanese-related sulfurtransferase